MIEGISEFKPITATWHYTKDELPKENEEVFCDTGDSCYGYQTLTYDYDVFYNSDGRWFEVIRWARVSEIVAMLNKNTSGWR